MIRWDDLDAKQMLANLADHLCESHLYEAIWASAQVPEPRDEADVGHRQPGKDPGLTAVLQKMCR